MEKGTLWENTYRKSPLRLVGESGVLTVKKGEGEDEIDLRRSGSNLSRLGELEIQQQRWVRVTESELLRKKTQGSA